MKISLIIKIVILAWVMIGPFVQFVWARKHPAGLKSRLLYEEHPLWVRFIAGPGYWVPYWLICLFCKPVPQPPADRHEN